LLHGFAWSDLIPVSLLTLGLILATMVLFDIPLASLAQILPDEVNHWAERLSILGSSGPYFLVCGLGWIALRLGAKDEFGDKLRNYSWALMLVICALIVSGVATNILKLIFAHLRPQDYFGSKGRIGFHFLHLDMIGSGFLRSFRRSYSFPSGHTTTAFALATVAVAYWPRFRLYLFSAAGVVGALRVLSLDHWPSDILAGALVGMVTAEYTIAIFNHAGVGPAAVWARQATIDQRLKWQPKGDYRALARNWKHWLRMRPFSELDKGSGR
ncbi:MAG: phosphatase PAP2 family protein, partial [Alphaproteobacteria bacterium]|nr:phosphatase PAP2 family protein [Alphaproteobacteria bacterium]